MMNVNFHNPSAVAFHKLDGKSGAMTFKNKDGYSVAMYAPSHVVEATAAAFNRAMQAVPQPDGSYTYTTDSGIWYISLDLAMRQVWLFQSEEITGDDDPSWLSGTETSLAMAMDCIDELVDENACPECHILVGEDNINEIEGERDMFLCDHCAETYWQGVSDAIEMAEDDKAHAAMDVRKGL